ncbi:metallophosphoesterase [Halomonas cupida]|uniref:metallophosphoesterase n=1 Tax=Halomonas cupida TaxID=44933 RepID=UPI003EFB1A05
MRLIQLSDCHLYADPMARSRRGLPARQLEAVIAAVDLDRPDLVMVTGDIAQDESEGAYRLATERLAALDCPWFWLPGNHDDLALMSAEREVLAEVDAGAWRVLKLNTQIPGEASGRVGEDALAALDQRLGQELRPTVIVMHHPPMVVGSAWIDALGLEDADDFWDVVGRYPQVKMVLCGHVHQAFHGTRALPEGQVEVYACPATSDQFLPGSDEFAVDEASRPGYRVVDLKRGGEWLTWVERVEL